MEALRTGRAGGRITATAPSNDGQVEVKTARLGTHAELPISSGTELFGDHPGLPGVIEQPACVHYRAHISQRFEMKGLARGRDLHCACIQINSYDIPGLQ